MSVSIRDARNAPHDREWIRAVYRGYLADLSTSRTGLFPVLGEWDAREDEFLSGWFTDTGSHPFVILVDGERAGFARVARPPLFPRVPYDYRMSEFFVEPGARRRGVGASAAALLFHRFSGDWEVIEDEHNRPALQFWRRVIAVQTGGRYTETRAGGEIRHRFRTEVRPHLSRARERSPQSSG